MGFLKRILYILISFTIIFGGCLPSIIKVKVPKDDVSYEMFGRLPRRDFYIREIISDSLKEKWQAKVNGGLTNSSVTIYGPYVFLNDLSGWVTCLDINNGKELGRIKNKGAVYSSPVIDKSILIFAVTLNDADYSDLYYYDYRFGNIKAKVKIEGKVLSEILKDKGKIIFNTEEGTVYCFNLLGDKLWETNTKIPIHCSTAMENDIIIFGNDIGEVIGLNADNGKILYTKKIGQLFLGCAAISDSTAFLGNYDGNIYAVRINDGKLKWKFATGTRIIATPVFSNTNVFVCNLSGAIYSLQKSNGNEIWKTDAGGVINATPLLANNYLLVPNLDDALLFVNPESGVIEKRFKLPSHAKLSPLIFRNTLFVGYDDGTIGTYEIVK